MSSLFASPKLVFSSAALLRIILLFYGLHQDANSSMKYTDIDYVVFTDAARFVSQGRSPYDRDTYRYTPLLAWLLVPTSWGGPGWMLFGKALFAIADIVAGWLIVLLLREKVGMVRALKYASIWLLNPMVATISTRGSSEGLLGIMSVALLWAVTRRRVVLAGILLGFGVHFKIYPFIFGPSIIWWMDEDQKRADLASRDGGKSTMMQSLTRLVRTTINPSSILLTLTALSVFAALNYAMYALYGTPFLEHTYFHHLTRIDHRHNFSAYNTLLYLSSSAGEAVQRGSFESLAFIPQLFLSSIAIPLALAKKDLAGTMLAQTFAFVAFNKVCTSQYFLWYLIFLPLYLPYSSLIQNPRLGISAATLWVLTQALWLHQAFRLEFHGISSFIPGLWLSSLAFFAVNVWILGIIVSDVGFSGRSVTARREERAVTKKKA